MSPAEQLGSLRQVPYMGVIHVVAEAVKLGFSNGHPDWCNLGQGQPEVGEMKGAPPRFSDLSILAEDHAYGPLEGIPELRQRIADHYNRLFRVGKSSQNGPENVSIAAGGRLSLTRAVAALGDITVGYPLPDYTAYEDILLTHLDRLTTIPVRGCEDNGFQVTPEQLREAIEEHDLGAWLFSNPCNPTGNVMQGDELAQVVDLCRSHGTTLLSDEFYSHFIYNDGTDAQHATPGAGAISAASHVEDVNEDPILIFDGLTKSFRYPGWRLGWIIGPPAMVEATARTASAIDGGPSRLSQRAALEILDPSRADQETSALREVFCEKRNVMVQRLQAMGIHLPKPSNSTFYCWGSLKDLPAPLNHGQAFFRRALQEKVLTVPGEYFDINPGKRRKAPSPYTQWMRFSFGPPMDNLLLGLDRLEAMIKK